MGAGSSGSSRAGGRAGGRRAGFFTRVARRITSAVRGGVSRVRNTLRRVGN